jgi:hypothetical protein
LDELGVLVYALTSALRKLKGWVMSLRPAWATQLNNKKDSIGRRRNGYSYDIARGNCNYNRQKREEKG